MKFQKHSSKTSMLSIKTGNRDIVYYSCKGMQEQKATSTYPPTEKVTPSSYARANVKNNKESSHTFSVGGGNSNIKKAMVIR